jgi:hypothetical protein
MLTARTPSIKMGSLDAYRSQPLPELPVEVSLRTATSRPVSRAGSKAAIVRAIDPLLPEQQAASTRSARVMVDLLGFAVLTPTYRLIASTSPRRRLRVRAFYRFVERTKRSNTMLTAGIGATSDRPARE